MRILADNLPTPKLETWKYTNLPRAVPEGLSASGGEQVVIHRSRGQNGGKAEEILWEAKDGERLEPGLKITVESGAELTVIERYQGQGAYWMNLETEIEVQDGGILHHIRYQQESSAAVHTNMARVRLGRDAVYDVFTLTEGAKLSRNEIHAELSGPGGSCRFRGLNLLRGQQHGDTTILIEHQAPNCDSRQFYRSVLDDKARGVFQGKVHVHQAAQKTDGYQLSNALLLSPLAEMDTKPELEIYADDVKCSHGATTGQLDEEPLFYLQSRGIPKAKARKMLIEAFLGEVIAELSDENIREYVSGRASAWLEGANA